MPTANPPAAATVHARRVTARVQLGPFPDILPADLAGVLVMVAGPDGLPARYRLAPEVMTRPAQEVRELAERVHEWQSTFLHLHDAGELRRLLAFLRLSVHVGQSQGTPLGVLEGLYGELAELPRGAAATVRIPTDSVSSLRAQLRLAQGVVAISQRRGWAVLDVTRERFALTEPDPDETPPCTPGQDLVLGEAEQAKLAVVSGLGLVLYGGWEPGQGCVIEEYRLTAFGTRLSGRTLTAGGRPGPVRDAVAAPGAAALLGLVVPGVGHGRVVRAPLSATFATPLVGLTDAAHEARSAGLPLHIDVEPV